MLRKLIAPALAAALMLAACDRSPSAPAAIESDDYALLMFGEPGTALEGVFGMQDSRRPYDGRTGRAQLPDSLRLTAEQIAGIRALRETFRTEHADEIAALRAVFEEARAARVAGASHEEVRAILLNGRLLAMELRFDVLRLHEAIWNVLTDAQKRWIVAHRPMRFTSPMARP